MSNNTFNVVGLNRNSEDQNLNIFIHRRGAKNAEGTLSFHLPLREREANEKRPACGRKKWCYTNYLGKQTIQS
jgi:hypothetical protein